MEGAGTLMIAMASCRVHVRGVVQGVGFRPFVFNLARQHGLGGSVINSAGGVEIVVEGSHSAIEAFVSELRARPPAAARIAGIAIEALQPSGLTDFRIGESERHGLLSAHVSPDLAACDDCLRELFDPANRRYWYPYINCTNCGPRFSLMTALPYDRGATTMAPWRMCADCHREFHDPADRRFHAQPIACPKCGPRYALVRGGARIAQDRDAVVRAASLLAAGALVAIKGLGGYHVSCDARNVTAVGELRRRKYRKARAFALMVRDVPTARALVEVSEGAEALLLSRGRPIVLAPARVDLPEVAPAHPNLGVMLPYAPLNHLLFAAGAPDALVMTSGNRSSEPIAFEDEDAQRRLGEIADAFLIGERPVARRVDDSVAHTTPLGPAIVRRSRGYAPAVVARLQTDDPILAVGGDSKNTVALAIGGDAIVSQHIGDLDHHATRTAFEQTIRDFLGLYDVDPSHLIVAYDRHPHYTSTSYALDIPARRHEAVQHHRAHVASVLAEREATAARVLGVAFDGTGFGDDGTIWGGEFLVGSIAEDFERVAHLRPARLPGGDAAAAFPVQAVAGFVADLGVPDLTDAPFHFSARYGQARRLVAAGVRTFTTTSVGRLFDAVAAMLGFTEEVTFEAQAAIWLEQQARAASSPVPVPFEYSGGELDWRPALRSVIDWRLAQEDVAAIALGFHHGLARGVADAVATLGAAHRVSTVILTGGVFQNQVLLGMLQELLAARGIAVWTNQLVPAGDGGLSLGQAAIASMRAQR